MALSPEGDRPLKNITKEFICVLLLIALCVISVRDNTQGKQIVGVWRLNDGPILHLNYRGEGNFEYSPRKKVAFEYFIEDGNTLCLSAGSRFSIEEVPKRYEFVFLNPNEVLIRPQNISWKDKDHLVKANRIPGV